MYGYANGDPVNFSDPFGLDLCDEIEDFDEWNACKGEQYAARDAAALQEAIEAGKLAAVCECLASGVLAGTTAVSDGAALFGIGKVFAGAARVARGVVWRAGQIWQEVGEEAGERAAFRAAGTGAMAVAIDQGFWEALDNFGTGRTLENLDAAWEACFN